LIFILLSITIAIYCLVQLIIGFGWFRYEVKESADAPREEQFISVIIAAHNEANNLKRFLPALLNQKYQNYEVILVLDRTEDEGETWLQTLSDTKLRLVKIDKTPPGWASKKWAVSQGIAAARYELLVFTDADCLVGEEWLQFVNRAFQKDREVVLGLGPYFREKGLLNAFIRYETFYTAFQFVGLTGIGMPYMGLGRNMAYRKSFYIDNGGFEAFKFSLSGDDDLMVNAYASADKTGVMLEKGSRVFSEPKKIFGAWIRQKWRHISASNEYSLRSKLILGIFHTSHLLFYLLTLAGWVWSKSPVLVTFLFFGKTIFSWAYFRIIRKKYQIDDFNYPWPVLDLLYFIYNLSIVPIGLIRKPTWI
jgi:biofilm PGA synthesis N-glycosyltransferase PgaC